MKKKIIDKLTNFIIKHKKCSDTDIKIYRYGLEALYNLTTKTIVIIIISVFLKTTKECLLLILFYTFLRLFAFGLHANGSLACWFTTIPIYIGGSLFIKYITILKYIVLSIWLIYLIFVILWAPADTKKRPLIREKQRKKLKIESIIICIIYLLLIVFVKNTLIINAIGFCMALEAICICPLTYKITGNRFNNYLYYKKSLN
jgi:accessory gene regulator B